jgi:endonuclease-3
MNPKKRREIYARLAAQNPAPTTELKYRSTFELLTSVILSAQATDVSVNKATAELYKVANTPKAMLDSKAANIIKTAKTLIEEYGGEVPRERAALERLPGVGRKTANVILNTAFGEPTIAVDTHIFRLSNRTGLAPGKTPLEVEKRLLKFTPDEYKRDAHHWLILHGRYVCKARKPECGNCVIADLCEFRHKTA